VDHFEQAASRLNNFNCKPDLPRTPRQIAVIRAHPLGQPVRVQRIRCPLSLIRGRKEARGRDLNAVTG